MGYYKMNTDASYFSTGSGAAGAVLRNSSGEAIAGCYCPLDNILSAATAEAIALLRGLELLEQLGCSKVIIESDSLERIHACNGTIEIWSPYSAILAECFLKASNIESVSFQHCPRKANQVAHNLAKFAYDTKQTFSWDGDPRVLLYLLFCKM
jgi:ribonuclease HI